jgi:hypothetical protein
MNARTPDHALLPPEPPEAKAARDRWLADGRKRQQDTAAACARAAEEHAHHATLLARDAIERIPTIDQHDAMVLLGALVRRMRAGLTTSDALCDVIAGGERLIVALDDEVAEQ